MDRKVLNLDNVTFKADETTGIIEGLANIGNTVDLQGDNILPGAWSKVIADGVEVPFCWGHDPRDVRGKSIYLEELPPGDRRIPLNTKGGKAAGNASGLFFKTQMAMRTQAGRDAFELLRGGFVKGISVTITNRREDEETDRAGVRNVKQVHELIEFSAVIKAASPGSQVLLTKALEIVKNGDANAKDYWQAVHDMACANGIECQKAAPVEIPTPAIAETVPPNVTALTVEAIAYARTLGALKGNEFNKEHPYA